MQTKGYNVKQVQGIVIQHGIDGHASWLGNEISDKFIGALLMRASDLEGASLKGGQETLLAVDARLVFVWKVTLKGDIYERSIGKMKVRGSVNLLRSIYGAKNVHIGNEASMGKLLATKKAERGTLKFYGLESLVKKAEPVAKTVKVKAKKKAKVSKPAAAGGK